MMGWGYRRRAGAGAGEEQGDDRVGRKKVRQGVIPLQGTRSSVA